MRMFRTTPALGLGLALACTAAAAEPLRVDWIERRVVAPPVLSNLAAPPEDLGLSGARLSLQDVAATGTFLGIEWELHETVVPPEQDFRAAAERLLADGARILVARAPAEDLLVLADLPQAQDALILNTSAPEDRLRGADCRANLLHTAPSTAMRTDALAQFLTRRQWTALALITGPQPEDRAFAEALKQSLAKFGLALAGEKDWPITGDMRRAAAEEVPLFTQDLPEHDILLVADERGDFGRYLPFNTWIPRPLAGSEGVKPLGWSGVVEQNGAAQLQNRFRALASREMQAADYAAWVAIAAVADARTRGGSGDPAALRAYLISDKVRIAGFLGRPLSFRAWDGQMRQPIPLVTERAVVGTAPFEGFLHATSELDTLGADRPETLCTAFGG